MLIAYEPSFVFPWCNFDILILHGGFQLAFGFWINLLAVRLMQESLLDVTHQFCSLIHTILTK